MKKIIAILLCVASLLPCMAFAEGEDKMTAVEAMSAETFTAKDGTVLPYRIYVPEGYDKEKEYSFLLFLHGAGDRGDDNEKQISVNMGMVERIVNGESVTISGESVDLSGEFIIVAPQCAKEKQWVDTPWGKKPDPSYSLDEIAQSQYMTAVVELLSEIEEKYSINENRMYITGLSMGGFGTWDLLMRYPEKWAAGIPMGGGADLSRADILKDIPIWTFHQMLDTVVSSEGTQNIVKEIIKLGGNIKFTPYFENRHNAWDYGYVEEDLLTWLYSHTKDTNPKAGESVVENVSESLKGEVALSYAIGLVPNELLADAAKEITREQFCTAILPIISGVEATEGEETFEDTDSEAVKRAYSYGIIKGVSEKSFEPERKITREEIAVMLSRAFNLMKDVIEEDIQVVAPDADKISPWAKEEMGLIIGHQIMLGDENGNVRPMDNTTVEEALAMIYRTYYAVNKYGVVK